MCVNNSVHGGVYASWGVCVLPEGHACFWGVCVLPRGCVLSGGCVCFPGHAYFLGGGMPASCGGVQASQGACFLGMHGFFGYIGYNEIWSMSGRYASYWNAFLFLFSCSFQQKFGKRDGHIPFCGWHLVNLECVYYRDVVPNPRCSITHVKVLLCTFVYF